MDPFDAGPATLRLSPFDPFLAELGDLFAVVRRVTSGVYRLGLDRPGWVELLQR